MQFKIKNSELLKGKRRFVLLHGYNGTPDGIFFPWLKSLLEKHGYEVEVPTLPNPTKPTEEEQVKYVLKNSTFDEHTVVFGHSLGAVVAMKVLERLDKPVAGLVLAGSFMRPKFKDRPRPFDTSFRWEFDMKKIQKLAESITVLHDTNDNSVPLEASQEVASELGVVLQTVTAKDNHFCSAQEPALLQPLLGDTVLVGTRNPAKVEMIRRAFAPFTELELLTLEEIGDVDDSALVEGDDFRANARLKAEFYFAKTGIPTVATDHILWMEKWPKDNGFITHIRKLANPKSNRATDDELAVWLEQFVKEHSQSRTAFHYAIGYADSKGTRDYVSKQREYLLKGEAAEARWEGYVVDRFLRDPATDAFRADQSPEIAFDHFFGFIRDEFVPRTFGLRSIKVFTTRPDTIFGATYLVIAPEHALITNHQSQITNYGEVQKYVELAARKSDLVRTDLAKEKTGVELKGLRAVNPANGEAIPVWVADYVLSTYGTGAIMAVPAHDERDFQFAKKYQLPIKAVILPTSYAFWIEKKEDEQESKLQLKAKQDRIISGKEFYNGDGHLINSEEFTGLESQISRKKIVTKLEKNGLAKSTVNYKLRDWVFSRQHYWGEPIPIIHCEECGVVPVPEKDLPVELPHVEKYLPTDTGESPLANVAKWVKVKCPKCGQAARRETDTMPNWAGSSWYFLSYTDPDNDQIFAAKDKLEHWLPVDMYNGGMEHTVLHLLYSRFWYKFLYDQGHVPTPEPYARRHSHGIILAEDGRKMSKSWGNVINPDSIVQDNERGGADTLRLYEMFIGPFEDAIPWSTEGLIGMRRFLDRVFTVFQNNIQWGLLDEYPDEMIRAKRQKVIHSAIKKITGDLDNFKFNTCVSGLMECFNEKTNEIGELENRKDEALLHRRWAVKNDLQTFLILLSPFAPHIAEELWQRSGGKGLIAEQDWPEFDPAKIVEDTITLVVQVNGKNRDQLTLAANVSEAEAVKAALASPKVQKFLSGDPKKTVFVPDKLINIVI
ncbi:MAG: leucine--tRNA ligase [bacterium]|nr:leucine--tRNA ligase [bacterium]